MFLVNFKEVWDGDRHLVRAPDQICFLQAKFIVYALVVLVKFDSLFDYIGYLGE